MTEATVSVATGGKGARIAAALAWTGLGLALACDLAELLAGLGYRWGWWHFRSGIQILTLVSHGRSCGGGISARGRDARLHVRHAPTCARCRA